MDILRDSQLVIFSRGTTFITFFVLSTFSFQILAKFEVAKTRSGVGFLRLTAVWLSHTNAIPVFQVDYLLRNPALWKDGSSAFSIRDFFFKGGGG